MCALLAPMGDVSINSLVKPGFCIGCFYDHFVQVNVPPDLCFTCNYKVYTESAPMCTCVMTLAHFFYQTLAFTGRHGHRLHERQPLFN